jgi:hypothetical protein
MKGRALLIELDGGGQADLVESDGEQVTLLCPRAFPPGSTLSGSSAIGALSIKVRRSTRALAAFRVEGRFVNLSRSQRAALSRS